MSEFFYSDHWFKTASDAELNCEREKVRQAFCSAGDNTSRAIELENLLHRFDMALSERAWGNETPRANSRHREHGWYLPNDDDE